jgi:para-aminobenzoate synthetase component 1
MLNWANQFNICCFLDNHHYDVKPHRFECILAAGAKKIFSSSAGTALEGLKKFSLQRNDWMFGHFSYDLKNELEALDSSQDDNIGFPDVFFFVPETILILEEEHLWIETSSDKTEEVIFKELCALQLNENFDTALFKINSRFDKAGYIAVVEQLKKHILAGDCYEINFCQEFYQQQAVLQPVQSYLQLTAISPNPFSAFYRVEDKYLLCASPERYLWKRDEVIISQPIKGTSKRDLRFPEEDQRTKEELRSSSKNRSENVMVVDLVRNDLSKVCSEGSVKVEELYAVHSFPQVHQMISTISGKARPELHWTDYIKATFPMGSMTGAPKKKVMELIEKYERSRRGLFSGSIGYVTPQQEFDFNVVIRSILYNHSSKYLSYQVGSAITFYSDPEQEYEECLLKAEAIKKVLT